MSAGILRRAASEIRTECPIPEHGRALDFIDYPTGWALQRAGLAHANGQCSAGQTSGAMLCDCAALNTSWRRWRTLLAVADWLDDAAENAEMLTSENRLPFDMRVHVANAKALAVARTFLGEA